MSTGAEHRGSLIVLSGPSGAGKTTVYRHMLGRHPEIRFSVSCTTRTPRNGEREGIDYTFLSVAEFQEHRRQGAFLECAEVHGNWYGTRRREVEDPLAAGQDVLLDVDIQGAGQVREKLVGTALAEAAVFVFCVPPAFEDLRRRLSGRGTDDAATVARRIANAHGEMAAWRDYDCVLVNDTVEQAAAELECIVLAARTRTCQYTKEPWRK